MPARPAPAPLLHFLVLSSYMSYDECEPPCVEPEYVAPSHHLIHSIGGCNASCIASRPTALEVKAAGDTVDVHDLACKVKYSEVLDMISTPFGPNRALARPHHLQ